MSKGRTNGKRRRKQSIYVLQRTGEGQEEVEVKQEEDVYRRKASLQYYG